MDVDDDNAKPINTVRSSAWLVEGAVGDKEVWICADDMDIKTVMGMVKRSRDPGFTIQAIMVGTFPVTEMTEDHHQAYFHDARKLGSDGKVHL